MFTTDILGDNQVRIILAIYSEIDVFLDLAD